VPDPPPKAAPTEDKIDPHLIHVCPGQYVAPKLSGTLTVAEDQYLRNQNRLLEQYHQRNPPVPTWQEQLHQAATTNLADNHPYQGSNNAWIHGKRSVHNPQPVESLTPSNAQDLGWRQSPYSTQTKSIIGNTAIVITNQSMPIHMLQHPFAPTTSVHPPARLQQPSGSGVAYPSVLPPQQAQHLPVRTPSNRGFAVNQAFQASPGGMISADAPSGKSAPITDTHPLIAANNPTADLAHLRGNQWEEAARRRAHEFNMLPKEHKEKKVSEFLQSNAPANIGLEASQPNRHSGLVQDYATPVAPGCGTPAVSNEHQLAPQQTQQAYRYQHQQPGAQTDRGHGAQSFAHHPSYSNATSAFPDPNAMYAWSIQKPPEKK
jgi:hypothetical protein